MSAAVNHEKLVDRKELAEITGLTPRTIETAKNSHGLPHHKIGRNVFYYPSEVFKWIEERKVIK